MYTSVAGYLTLQLALASKLPRYDASASKGHCSASKLAEHHKPHVRFHARLVN
uniref:Uncharacterized protein n=1 Tax=Anguilla anguilla TaxID=7936 RepID=A0A0E9X8C2_ANGAN